MKTISLGEAQADLPALLDAAQKERIVVKRGGKPSVVIVGVEAYDDEDLRLANSMAFWQLIEERRKGRLIPFADVQARLEARERLQESGKPEPRAAKPRKGPRRRKGR